MSTKRCKYFSIEELVCDHMLKKYDENTLWGFLDDKFKETIDFIREYLNSPLLCNYSGLHQRGMRCNMCPIVKSKTSPYLSAHVLGKAGDFNVEGMSAEVARNKIIELEPILPYPIRLEKDVTWVHIDVMDFGQGKLYQFKA